MDSANLNFENSCMSLNRLTHHTVHLSQEVKARLEGLNPLAMDCKMDIPNGKHVSADYYSSNRKPSATTHTAYFRKPFLLNTSFRAVPPPFST